MEEMELFAKTVHVQDTGKVVRQLPLNNVLSAMLYYVESWSDANLKEAKQVIDWEHLSRSVIIRSQTKVT